MAPSELAPALPNSGNEFDGQRLWRGIRRNQGLIVYIATAVVMTAMVLTVFQPYQYESVSTLVVKSQSNESGLSSLANQLAPGLSSGAGAVNLFTEMEVVRSQRVLGQVVDQEHLQVWVTDTARERTVARRVSERLQVALGLVEKPEAEDLQNRERPIVFTLTIVPVHFEKTEWDLTRTGDDTFVVEDRKTRKILGNGTIGEPFEADGATLHISAITGEPGDLYRLRFRTREAAIRHLQEKLDVRRVRDRAELMAVAFNDPNPVLAKIIVNRIVEAYLTQALAWKTELGEELNRMLVSQIAQAEQDLLDAQVRWNDFRAESDTVLLGKEAEGIVTRLGDAKLQLATQQIDASQLQFAYDRLKVAGDREFLVFLSGAGNPAVTVQASLIAELNDLISRREAMLTSRTEEHPEVQRMAAQIDVKRAQILALVDQALRTARQKESLLAEQVAQLEGQRSNIPEIETTYTRYTADLALMTQLVQALKQRKQSNEITQAAASAPFRVLDPAIAPLKHHSPRWAVNLLLGLMVGAGLGLVVATAQTVLDTSIRRREQAESLGLPVVAQIPRVQEHLPASATGLGRLYLALRHDPLGVVAESFRILRSATTLATGAGMGRVLGITSTGVGEGKTLVTLNLAAMYANAGQRTLVIDTDLRRPAVARSFGIPSSPGLSDVLEGKAQVQEVLRDSGITGLWVLPAGSKTTNPAELLLGEQFTRLLQSLKREGEAGNGKLAPFDVILLDLPPVEPVAETMGLGRLTTALYLLIRAGQTPIGIVRDALTRLAQGKVAVRGLILNDVTREDLGTTAARYLYYSYAEGESDIPDRGLWERLMGGGRRKKPRSGVDSES